VDKDNIDLSIGLAFSLNLLARYRENGVLHAEMHHVSGINGRCKVYLHLTAGKVVSCYAESKNGQRHQIHPDILCRVDEERGPFEWSLLSQPASSTSPSLVKPLPRPVKTSPIPRRSAQLRVEQLSAWTPNQRTILYTIFTMIDGQKTIEELKANGRFPPDVVEEALRILFSLNVIVIQ
jgi:hypothetical protein